MTDALPAAAPAAGAPMTLREAFLPPDGAGLVVSTFPPDPTTAPAIDVAHGEIWPASAAPGEAARRADAWGYVAPDEAAPDDAAPDDAAPGDAAPDDAAPGRPPAAHRFRKGASGNPRGAPRRPPLRIAQVETVLSRKWPVWFGDQVVARPVGEVLLMRLFERAMQGEARAMIEALRLMGDVERARQADAARRAETARNRRRRKGEAPAGGEAEAD